jgi:hypothetical protein
MYNKYSNHTLRVKDMNSRAKEDIPDEVLKTEEEEDLHEREGLIKWMKRLFKDNVRKFRNNKCLFQPCIELEFRLDELVNMCG